jgi:hypothetical protein
MKIVAGGEQGPSLDCAGGAAASSEDGAADPAVIAFDGGKVKKVVIAGAVRVMVVVRNKVWLRWAS